VIKVVSVTYFKKEVRSENKSKWVYFLLLLLTTDATTTSS